MKPRFRLKAVGNDWYAMPVNDAAVNLKISAWALFTPML